VWRHRWNQLCRLSIVWTRRREPRQRHDRSNTERPRWTVRGHVRTCRRHIVRVTKSWRSVNWPIYELEFTPRRGQAWSSTWILTILTIYCTALQLLCLSIKRQYYHVDLEDDETHEREREREKHVIVNGMLDLSMSAVHIIPLFSRSTKNTTQTADYIAILQPGVILLVFLAGHLGIGVQRISGELRTRIFISTLFWFLFIELNVVDCSWLVSALEWRWRANNITLKIWPL